jgi:hypothetical protein
MRRPGTTPFYFNTVGDLFYCGFGELVKVDFSDEVWELFKRSWALLGVRTHDELVRVLESQVREESVACLDGAENRTH